MAFSSSLLDNAKVVGEPYREHNFPPVLDMMAETMNCPRAAEKIEFKIFSRLYAVEPGA